MLLGFVGKSSEIGFGVPAPILNFDGDIVPHTLALEDQTPWK